MKDVTNIFFLEINVYTISIHTSVKDVTQNKLYLAYIEDDFNPHIREGCDAVTKNKKEVLYLIHTSVKDVTKMRLELLKFITISIHTSVKDDAHKLAIYFSVSILQSTSVKDVTSKFAENQQNTYISIHIREM